MMMFKRILTLMFLLFLLSDAQAGFFTRGNGCYHPNGVDSVIGTIQGRSRNTIEIYDEQDKRTKRFIYLGDRGEFKSGDRVRLFYYPDDHVVQIIKRETPVQYQKNGQNTGYIFKSAL